ncbi:cobalamin biosynthesis central domain-containing protein [Ottowia testudinis]|uniref:Cobalamin biosynthesis protein CbiG n=1 Tax=Ottowia testudinis TaxID=2816950 RepID=A0A975CJ98_9BURK|nr:cobalamin biosynthesis central domain-containing protein [Ottowia testudinis]QTD46836.1 cobalamin biosynthesis protein CbiG [Ottowia testudinis]
MSDVKLFAPATPPEQVRVGLLAITKHGVAQAVQLAGRWPDHLPPPTLCTSAKFAADAVARLASPLRVYDGPLSAEIGTLFAAFDQIVCFVSLGAVVRLIAPHLKSKDEDPGVIVVDDAGQHVIAVLSGHVGGANDWAERVAALLGATPVITTASDVGKTIPVDILGRHLGWRVEAPKLHITRVSAHVVNGEPIALVQEAGSRHWWTRATPLPANVEVLSSFNQVRPEHHRAVLWVTHAPIAPYFWSQWAERLVVYRPPVGQGAEDKA